MGILNYTTTVPVNRTISQIQGILVSHGAKSIMINYTDNQEPESLSFLVKAGQGDLPFRLPAKVKAVEQVMWRDRLPGYKKDGQAARVAWRIVKDWVEAQMAIIEAEMVSMEEVFLPYLLRGDRTLYQEISKRGFLLPEGKE
ncbi:MAG: hypothetical protein JRE40_07285 [Deltaproteobacteria bacterium]|nr:hypothetical protein [Deltaproteobacteria bacterium]